MIHTTEHMQCRRVYVCVQCPVQWLCDSVWCGVVCCVMVCDGMFCDVVMVLCD